MRVRYGKASADLIPELENTLRQNAELLQRQTLKAARHRSGVPRPHCVLCGQRLDEATDHLHRQVPYKVCGQCGHWQTQFETSVDVAFDQIYPDLSPDAFASRVSRIYQPKLDWILSQADALGTTAEGMLGRSWVELGSGSGGFLKALRTAGASDVQGLEQNPALCQQARVHAGANVEHFDRPLHQALQSRRADIWVAFFVIEHVADPAAFWAAVRALPEHTVFVLAVPLVGFAANVEGAFDHFFARSLDSVVHTQMYTRSSLHHALKLGGLVPKASWVFGQDIQDLWRMLLVSAQSAGVQHELPRLQHALFSLTDPLQAILDRHQLSDSIHMLCVREN